jgi:predicted MFS family arabinose efflux permease
VRTVEPVREPAEQGGNLRTQIAEGLRYVLRHPLLRPITCSTGTFNFFNGIQNAVIVLFLARVLGLAPGTIGLLFTAGGIGGLLGAITSAWAARRFGQARVIWLSVLVTAPFGLLIPVAQADWRIALIFIADVAIGYGVVVYNVAQVSFRQAICPDRLLGRMNASIRFLVWGTLPLGALVGGLLGEWLGVRGALWVAMGGQILAVLWVLGSPLRTMRDLPTEQPAAMS